MGTHPPKQRPYTTMPPHYSWRRVLHEAEQPAASVEDDAEGGSNDGDAADALSPSEDAQE